MAAKALLGFAAWTGIHVGIIVSSRTLKVLSGQKATGFTPSSQNTGSDFIARVSRSHANCLENLPLFAAVILVNKVYGGPNLDLYATYYLVFRILQSLTHWLSVADVAVKARFTFYILQMWLFFSMAYQTYTALP